MAESTGPASRQYRAALGLLLAVLITLNGFGITPTRASERRMTPLVKAVQRARPSVVNVFGEKRLGPGRDQMGQYAEDRRVNGMGTGVIVDPRGYILTNYHVVEGVQDLQVTLNDGQTYNAKLLSYDRKTDLALIKVDAGDSLPVVPIGASGDLLPGETVVAVGNAFGYGHTVTSGIISAMHRTVQVNEEQSYEDLIQTDASINPGNSGGPLLNIDGEMIGINVAVRAGAQGIGFAIPADKALQVAAGLMNTRRVKNLWHGVVLEDKHDDGHLAAVVTEIESGSPASQSGLRVGDRVVQVEDSPVERSIDLERGLLACEAGESVQVTVDRQGLKERVQFTLAKSSGSAISEDRVWSSLGLRLEPADSSIFRRSSTRYRGGLKVTEVRPNSAADRQGIAPGDILVGMHVWETVSLENVRYVLKRADGSNLDPVKFYILRDGETLYGYLPLDGDRTARR